MHLLNKPTLQYNFALIVCMISANEMMIDLFKIWFGIGLE